MVAIYILLGVLGGAFLVGLIAAVMIFFRELNSLKSSLDELKNVIRTLSKDNTLAESLQAFGELVKTGQSLIKKVEVINDSINQFYKVALRSEQALASAAPTGSSDVSSGVYFTDESRAATEEAHRIVRGRGVVEPQSADVEVSSAKAVKAGDV